MSRRRRVQMPDPSAITHPEDVAALDREQEMYDEIYRILYEAMVRGEI
jgi:hypothetical protein